MSKSKMKASKKVKKKSRRESMEPVPVSIPEVSSHLIQTSKFSTFDIKEPQILEDVDMRQQEVIRTEKHQPK
jgi:hypothetical protein